jgi:Transglycosylase SLT domain
MNAFISEASHHFSIPQAWIRAVSHQESGGMIGIVSAKGAIGLMQVVPDTYLELAHPSLTDLGRRPPFLMDLPMRSLDLTNVDVYCACGHQASLDVSKLPGDLAVPDVQLRLRCSKCGKRRGQIGHSIAAKAG